MTMHMNTLCMSYSHRNLSGLPTSWTTKRAVLLLQEGVPISSEGYDVDKHLELRCE